MHREIPHSTIPWQTPDKLYRGTSIAFIEYSILRHMTKGHIAYSGWQQMSPQHYPNEDLTFVTPEPQLAVVFATQTAERYARDHRSQFCDKLMHHPVILEFQVHSSMRVYEIPKHDGFVIPGKLPLNSFKMIFGPGIDRLGQVYTDRLAPVAAYLRSCSKEIEDTRDRILDGDISLRTDAQRHIASQKKYTLNDYVEALDHIYKDGLTNI